MTPLSPTGAVAFAAGRFRFEGRDRTAAGRAGVDREADRQVDADVLQFVGRLFGAAGQAEHRFVADDELGEAVVRMGGGFFEEVFARVVAGSGARVAEVGRVGVGDRRFFLAGSRLPARIDRRFVGVAGFDHRRGVGGGESGDQKQREGDRKGDPDAGHRKSDPYVAVRRISPPEEHPVADVTRNLVPKSIFFGNVVFMVGLNGVNGYANDGIGNGVGEVNRNGTSTTAISNGNGKRRGSESIPVNWERLARATAHPLRISILEILGIDGGRVLSPSELSQELQIPLSNTNYHVTELAKADLIVLVRQRAVRGATEHFYTLPEALPKVEAESSAAAEADRCLIPPLRDRRPRPGRRSSSSPGGGCRGRRPRRG